MAETEVPDVLRKTLDRLGPKALAAVVRYASGRLGALGGVEGGAKRWKGMTKEQRREAARNAVLTRWARVRAERETSTGEKP